MNIKINSNHKKNILPSGYVLLEIVVVISIVSLVLVSLFGAIIYPFKVNIVAQQTLQAHLLAQDTLEAARSFRDNTEWGVDGINTLTTGDSHSYYPKIQQLATSTILTLTPGTETLNNFTRWLIIENVSRDPITKDIETVYNVLNNDSYTKKVIAYVNWDDQQIELITYLTNWK